MKGLTEGLDQTCEVNFWPSLSLCFQRIVKGLRGSYCRSSCFAVAFAFVSLYQSVINSSSQSCACLPQRTTVYLLLALHREIATLYRDASADFSLKQEVGLHLSGNRDFAFDIACVFIPSSAAGSSAGLHPDLQISQHPSGKSLRSGSGDQSTRAFASPSRSFRRSVRVGGSDPSPSCCFTV